MDSLLSMLAEYHTITRRELRALLCGQISTDERQSLKNGSDGLVISVHNRKTIIRMIEDTFPYEADNEPVDVSQVISLIQALQSYLNKYMADKPEGHRWITICCIYLSMVAHEPLHPREAAHWEWDSGVGEYRCRFREDVEGSICRWCRCIPVKEL